nr:MAG TPA: hypothetical protein [Bacteriophage sp.]
MLENIYLCLVAFCSKLFVVVGALVCVCIALIAFLFFVCVLYEYIVHTSDKFGEYLYFRKHAANFELWLDSNGLDREWETKIKK